MENEAEKNEEVENDVFEMLATQSEDHEDELDEVAETDDKGWEKRINSKNQIIRKAQQANQRIIKDNEALEKRLEELEKQAASPAPNTEAQNQERKEVLEQWRESVSDKPETALDYTNAVVGDLKNTMVDLMTAQQADYESRLASIKGDLDPEKNKYRGKINSLRQNPELSDMDDKTLMKFAKTLEKVPRGSVGGRRASSDPDPDKRLEELKARFKTQYSNG